MGLSSPWDSLPDSQHPVAWAYLARGVRHFISPPTHGAKAPFYAGGLVASLVLTTELSEEPFRLE
jgi:hypothetical protein